MPEYCFYVIGKLRPDSYFLPCYGVCEVQLSAVERLSANVTTSAAVKVITCKGMADI